MKIIVIGTRGFPGVQGGVEKHCEDLYSTLAAKGHEVIVFTRKGYGDPSLKSYRGARLIPLWAPRNKFFEAIIHTVKSVILAKKYKADIMHIHAVGPFLCVPLAKWLGFKVVITDHGPDYMREKWNCFAKCMLRKGEKWGSRQADSVICISRAIADDLYLKYKRESRVIPNGVRVPEIINTDAAMTAYGLEAGKYFLAVGRFVPEKGFEDMINAFNRFQELFSSEEQKVFKLVIVGGADHESDYSRKLKELASQNENIVMTGILIGDELQELYFHAGLFILPSYYEGLPIVLLEAGSYGLSCIVSDIQANREVGLEDERHFRPGDTETLAWKMHDFINRPVREEEKLARIDHIRRDYSWDKIADQTIEVYEEVLKKESNKTNP